MNKKWLVTAIASTVLISGIGVATVNQPNMAQAATTHSYYWWEKPRKVRITKNHKIYEIQGVIPRAKSYEIRSKTLKRGSIVKIHHAASFLWIVQGKGLVNNYSKWTGRFWVANGSKGWYSLNLKPKRKTIVSTSLKKNRNYQQSGSAYKYSDKNISLQITLNQFDYNNQHHELTAPMVLHNYSTKRIYLPSLFPKYLRIQQDGKDVRYNISNDYIKPKRTLDLALILELPSENPVTFSFKQNNRSFTYRIPSSSKSNSNSSNTVNKNANSTNSIPGFNTNASIIDQIHQALSLTGTDKTNAELQIAKELNIDTSSMTQDNLESTLRDYAQSHSTTTTTSAFQWPAGTNGYMAKAAYIFSLSGEQRRAADLELMKEMGMTENGQPEVSISRFENQLRKIYDDAQAANNWILNGHN